MLKCLLLLVILVQVLDAKKCILRAKCNNDKPVQIEGDSEAKDPCLPVKHVLCSTRTSIVNLFSLLTHFKLTVRPLTPFGATDLACLRKENCDGSSRSKRKAAPDFLQQTHQKMKDYTLAEATIGPKSDTTLKNQ